MSDYLENIQFIQDTPITDVSDMQFGHEEIASSVCQIISNVSFNITIGLFGGWGTGKSSILNAIEGNLTKNEAFFIFDVWKHKDDALRRTFITNFFCFLHEKKYFSKKISLSDQLTQSTEHIKRSNETDYTKLIIPGIVSLTIWSLFFLISFFAYELSFQNAIFALFIAIINTLFFCLFFLKENYGDLQIVTTISRYEDKFLDPIEFEKEFIKILKTIKENLKIIIVFDNLDRVPEDKAIEILTTIKTFLEPNSDKIKNDGRLIFLIPCDHDSIKHHVSKMYGIERDDDSQNLIFLEKFFNCKILIPPFFGVELDKFTFELLEKTGISCFKKQENEQYSIETHHTAWNIIKGNRSNPRQIKQFINDLLARYTLIQLRSREGGESDFEPDFCQKNISKITKALIIQEKFPNCLNYLLNKGYLNPDEFLKDVFLDLGEDDSKKSKFSDLQTDSNEFKNFKQFLNDTKNDLIEDLIPYIHGRISDFEKQLPDIRKIIILLDRGDYELLEYEISHNPIKEIGELFGKVIQYEIERKQIIDNIAQFFDTFFKILLKFNIILSEDVIREIYNKFRQYPALFSMLSPILVHDILTQKNNKPIELFFLTYWIQNLPYEYVQVFSIIFDEEISQINSNSKLLGLLNNKLKSLIENVQVISTLFKLSEESQKKYIFPDTVKTFLIKNDSLSSLEIITVSVLISNELIKDDIFKEIIKSIDFGKINQMDNNAINELSNKISQFIIKFKEYYYKIFIDDYETITKNLSEFYKVFAQFQEKEKILHPLLIMESFFINTENSTYDRIIEKIHEILLLEFERFLPYISLEVSSLLIKNHLQEIIERLRENNLKKPDEKRKDFFITIFSNLTNEEKSLFLNEFATNATSSFIIQIKNLRNLHIEYQYSKDVVESLLNIIINGLNHTDTYFIIDDIIDHFPSCTEISNFLISIFIKRFEEANESQFEEYHKIFEKCNFFSEDDKKNLIKNGTNKLNGSNIQRYQQYLSLIIVLINQNEFPNEKRVLSQKLLEISISGINSQTISNIFGQLKTLNFCINYHENISFYDDLIYQISNNRYPETKCILAQSLLTLSPSKVNLEEQVFWNQVEDLKNKNCKT